MEVARKFVPILEQAGADIMLCGHLHRYVRQDAGQAAAFPVIVNSNDTVLIAEADGHCLKIKVIGMDGKVVDSYEIKK